MSDNVLVVGGGPAGSVTATFLAQEGFSVRLIESQHFPRYHIGESLTPASRRVLDMIGVADRLDELDFQRKRGGVFLWGDDTWVINWSEIFGVDVHTWQVDRGRFDALLLDNAREKGVKVEHGITAKSVTFGDTGRPTAVDCKAEDGTDFTIEGFDFLVDASGRSGLLSSKHLRNRKPHEIFRNVAIWGYWDNARALPTCPEGGINVISSPKGWYWVIPLGGGRNSVGLVTHKDMFAEDRQQHSDVESLYHAYLDANEPVKELLSGATYNGPVRVETDYSYVADEFSGPGYMMVGDAACFLDPLLSSGIHFAMYGGMVGAAALASARRGEVTEAEGLRFFEVSYKRAYTRMLTLVSNMYQGYRGKNDFFWTADRLVGKDRTGKEEAFGEVIGGLSDIREATDASTRIGTAKLEEEARRVQQPELNPNRPLFGAQHKMGQEEDPIDGLQLVTSPRLGLQRVSETSEADSESSP
ncbi:NAD(P)/FAD-dependent oxidoreductase [Streptomyces prunicolor]|uniref:NAD(P)/FAD-dependent oxidoreductase n=1 Tax=Streptomyces prunicolor TaxID=67348 RepID=UPI0003646A42|nr:NAD(P)/FAD-dependent oxidoreductase [Streptomyces prunicolor]